MAVETKPTNDALGFRNINHYVFRCLIHSGGSQPKINVV